MASAFSPTTEARDEDLLSPDQYAEAYPFGAWTRLRREDPVHWVAEWAGDPYWAITRHSDIIEVSKQPDLFPNNEACFLYPHGENVQSGRTLLDMDPPEHRVYRSLVSKRFTPRALIPIQKRIDHIASDILEAALTGDSGRLDFVVEVAARLPIWVIAELLGIPDTDWKKLFDWTNATFGAADPEFRKGRSIEETKMTAMNEMFAYFEELSADRAANPRDDLASDISRAVIDGKPIPSVERLSYYIVILGAGNETVRNATSGGLLALIENPDQLELARRQPELIDGLVEEILRYVSPVIHMARTAARDTELGGHTIRAGQKVGMFYPSANRDESVFPEPNRFRIDRNPNRHLAFGVGEHVCIGAHVARMELRALFRQLTQRLESVELDGPIERLRMNAVAGIKHMPIRYELRPDA